MRTRASFLLQLLEKNLNDGHPNSPTLVKDVLLKFCELFAVYFPLLHYLLSQENLLEFIILLKLSETQSVKLSF